MLNWLKGLYNGAKGVLSDIEKWVVGALNVVYSYFDNLISQAWRGIQTLANAVNNAIAKIESTLYSLYTSIQWVITKGIPQLANWALNELRKLADYIKAVYNWALGELKRLETWARGEFDKLTQWVIHHIWDPLWTAITSTVKWIEKEGAFVYYLLTHPDKLAALLGQYILAQWMNLGKKFAKPFTRWLVHNIIAEIPSVSGIIEDIIASLF